MFAGTPPKKALGGGTKSGSACYRKSRPDVIGSGTEGALPLAGELDIDFADDSLDLPSDLREDRRAAVRGVASGGESGPAPSCRWGRGCFHSSTRDEN